MITDLPFSPNFNTLVQMFFGLYLWIQYVTFHIDYLRIHGKYR